MEKEKMSLNFHAYGAHHHLSLGSEKAAIFAYYAYCASTDVGLGTYGVGRFQTNGYHGNEKNEFKVYSMSVLGSTKNFDPKTITFVPMKTFCTNGTQLRT